MAAITFGTPGNVGTPGTLTHATSISVNATSDADLDFSTRTTGFVTVAITPGATISAVRGVLVEFFRQYSTTTSNFETIAASAYTYTMPCAVASTLESKTITFPPGKWKIQLTNLDATYDVTYSITADYLA